MLTQVDIQNYRSIYQSSIALSPFTLLIGANGAGKSNFLRLLKDVSANALAVNPSIVIPSADNTQLEKEFRASARLSLPTHHSFALEDQLISVHNDNHQSYSIQKKGDTLSYFLKEDDELINSLVLELEKSCLGDFTNNLTRPRLPELEDVKIFSLEPYRAALSESLVPNPTIKEDGSGLVQVLDSLKTGDREDLFHRIESIFKSYIPEVEKLSFVSDRDTKSLQVRERYSLQPVPLGVLSKGTQLALTIIAILNQEIKPSLVCIEDIDQGLHPRLCRRLVKLCQALSHRKDGVQIIATTHSPALISELKGKESSVVLVEKKNGQTQFRALGAIAKTVSR